MILPLMVVLVLVVMFLRRLAVDGSHLARLLIASAREFIADAEALRLTQNPAALVSALRRIEGRSVIPGVTAGQDAMMIDGANEGAYATHPTIAERIAAIVSVTGSMALIAPSRRDTRPPELRASEGFGRRLPGLDLQSAFTRRVREGAGAALARVSSGDEFNRLGLTREMTFGAVAAVGVFLWFHAADLGKPAALAKAFDPAPMRTFFAMGGEGLRCQLQGIGWLAGLAEKPTGCEEDMIDGMLAAHEGEDNILGMLVAQRADVRDGIKTFNEGDGTFSSAEAPDAELAEVKLERCFQTDNYSVGDRGLHSIYERPSEGETISLTRYLMLLDAAAARVSEAPASARDAAILEYFEARKQLGMVIHRFFGDPGLNVAGVRFTLAQHQAAVALLRERLSDPAFAKELDPLARAELDLLAKVPQDFISCTARRSQA
jgi:hypothetical protein